MKKVFDDKVVQRAMTAAGKGAVSGNPAIRAGKFVTPRKATRPEASAAARG